MFPKRKSPFVQVFVRRPSPPCNPLSNRYNFQNRYLKQMDNPYARSSYTSKKQFLKLSPPQSKRPTNHPQKIIVKETFNKHQTMATQTDEVKKIVPSRSCIISNQSVVPQTNEVTKIVTTTELTVLNESVEIQTEETKDKAFTILYESIESQTEDDKISMSSISELLVRLIEDNFPRHSNPNHSHSEISECLKEIVSLKDIIIQIRETLCQEINKLTSDNIEKSKEICRQNNLFFQLIKHFIWQNQILEKNRLELYKMQLKLIGQENVQLILFQYLFEEMSQLRNRCTVVKFPTQNKMGKMCKQRKRYRKRNKKFVNIYKSYVHKCISKELVSNNDEPVIQSNNELSIKPTPSKYKNWIKSIFQQKKDESKLVFSSNLPSAKSVAD